MLDFFCRMRLHTRITSRPLAYTVQFSLMISPITSFSGMFNNFLKSLVRSPEMVLLFMRVVLGCNSEIIKPRFCLKGYMNMPSVLTLLVHIRKQKPLRILEGLKCKKRRGCETPLLFFKLTTINLLIPPHPLRKAVRES